MLYLHRKHSVVGPMASRSLLAEQIMYAYPFHAVAKGLCPLPTKDQYTSRVGQVTYDHVLKQNKRTLTELETGMIFSHKVTGKPSTLYMGSLSPDVQECQTQGPSLFSQVSGGKTVCMRLPFTKSNIMDFLKVRIRDGAECIVFT